MNRLQQLAGLITESQLNEDILELKQMSKQLYSFLKKKGFDVELTNKIKVPLRPENPKGGTMTTDKSSVRSTRHGMPVQIQVFEGTEEMVAVGITPDNVAKVLVGGGTTGEDRWSYKAEKRFGNDWGAWQKNPEIMKYVNNLGNEMLAQIKERYPNMVYKFDQENFLYLLYFGYAQTRKGGQKNLSQRPNAPKPTPQPQAESLDIDSIVNEALKSVRK